MCGNYEGPSCFSVNLTEDFAGKETAENNTSRDAIPCVRRNLKLERVLILKQSEIKISADETGRK
jgi:hypothetical protein